ncbi:MAG TPA: methyltransferase type 11 [Alphaproteobacteria bacterium]|nr:methyltransferase type 11 [Alphaproteobacteria bacterium]HAJ48007.1 methyltransferase type 11 [Alphaproteobacteria bacterium]
MSIENIKDYYGRVLQTSSDLKTDACCTPEAPPAHIRAALALVHPDVKARYYGCGLIAPEKLEGLNILDLGCGSGQDAYVLAHLAGPKGRVTGIDMTERQIAEARKHEDYHAQAFGFPRANTRFEHGYIEDLRSADIGPDTQDVIISNCVLNLSPDKPKVLAEAFRVLKTGGEFYFSDIYADRRLPAAWRDDPVLLGECLGGALYWNDFLQMAKQAGFADPRLVSSRPLQINDTIRMLTGQARFFSATYRLFKLKDLEPSCEDHGQAVIYEGGIAGAQDLFVLDGHHRIEAGRIFPVCGNTFRMLQETRFAPHFRFIGDFSKHYGIFPGCGTNIPFTDGSVASAAAACC